MGIDLIIGDPESEGAEETRMTSVGGFILMSLLMGGALEFLRENPPPIPQGPGTEGVVPPLEWLDAFPEEQADAAIARFDDYLQDMSAAADEMEKEMGNADQQFELWRVPAEEFHPGVKAYLGHALLREEPIQPAEVTQISLFGRMMCGVMGVFTRHFDGPGNDPEQAAMYKDAADILRTFCVAVETAGEREVPLHVSW